MGSSQRVTTPVPAGSRCRARPAAGRIARWLHCVATILLLVAWSVATSAQPAGRASAESIKAAYLYRFAAYVEWPEWAFPSDSAPIVIGVFRANLLADELREMTADRTVAGRRIVVRRIRSRDSLEGVHILFVSASGSDDLSSMLDVARAQSVLVVTEVGEALEMGSVINFRPVDQRIRFDVSLESAERNRLKLSARLLAVADHVQPRSQ